MQPAQPLAGRAGHGGREQDPAVLRCPFLMRTCPWTCLVRLHLSSMIPFASRNSD